MSGSPSMRRRPATGTSAAAALPLLLTSSEAAALAAPAHAASEPASPLLRPRLRFVAIASPAADPDAAPAASLAASDYTFTRSRGGRSGDAHPDFRSRSLRAVGSKQTPGHRGDPDLLPAGTTGSGSGGSGLFASGGSEGAALGLGRSRSLVRRPGAAAAEQPSSSTVVLDLRQPSPSPSPSPSRHPAAAAPASAAAAAAPLGHPSPHRLRPPTGRLSPIRPSSAGAGTAGLAAGNSSGSSGSTAAALANSGRRTPLAALGSPDPAAPGSASQPPSSSTLQAARQHTIVLAEDGDEAAGSLVSWASQPPAIPSNSSSSSSRGHSSANVLSGASSNATAAATQAGPPSSAALRAAHAAAASASASSDSHSHKVDTALRASPQKPLQDSSGAEHDALGAWSRAHLNTSLKAEGSLFGICSMGGGYAGVPKENQDNFFLFTQENTTNFVAGVLDGHGMHGAKASAFVKMELGPRILSLIRNQAGPLQPADLAAAIEATAHALSRTTIDVRESGTTLALAVRSNDKLYVAHVGDSRCVLGRRSEEGWHATQLTRDHKPADALEKERVHRAGGFVEPTRVPGQGFQGPARVWRIKQTAGGLAISRSIGDINLASAGVVPLADVLIQDLSSEDGFVILATDGVWDHIRNEVAVNLVAQQRDARQAAQVLVKAARKMWTSEGRGYIDDVTALVLTLP